MVGRISYTLEKNKGPTDYFFTERRGHTVVRKGPVWPDKNGEWPEDPEADFIDWEDIYNIFDYHKIKIIVLE